MQPDITIILHTLIQRQSASLQRLTKHCQLISIICANIEDMKLILQEHFKTRLFKYHNEKVTEF